MSVAFNKAVSVYLTVILLAMAFQTAGVVAQEVEAVEVEAGVVLPDELIIKESTLTPEEQETIDRYVNHWSGKLNGLAEEDAKLFRSTVGADGRSGEEIVAEKSEALSRDARKALIMPIADREPSTFFKIAYTRTLSNGIAKYNALDNEMLVVRMNALMALAWGGDTQALELSISRLDPRNETSPACRYWAAKSIRHMLTQVGEEIIFGAAEVEVRIATKTNLINRVKNSLIDEKEPLPLGEKTKLLYTIGDSEALAALFKWMNGRADAYAREFPPNFEGENALLREMRSQTKGSWDIPPTQVPEAFKAAFKMMSTGAALGAKMAEFRTDEGHTIYDAYYSDAIELLQHTDIIIRNGLQSKLKVSDKFPSSYFRMLKRTNVDWTQIQLTIEEMKVIVAKDEKLGLKSTDLGIVNLNLEDVLGE